MTLPWMPTYVQNWLTSEKVAAMTIAQEGAYHRLLLLAWDNKDCTVPADRTVLMKLAKWNGYPDADFDAVLACFLPHPKLKDRVFNRVLMDEWKKALKHRAHIVAVRKAASAKRWHSKSNANGKQRHAPDLTIPDHTGPKKKKEKKAAQAGVDDQVWMEDVKADKAYQGLNVDQELAKAQRWAKEHDRKCSRRFFVNWLNRAERPMTAHGKSQAPARSLVELGMRK
jgi:hypothetical protein